MEIDSDYVPTDEEASPVPKTKKTTKKSKKGDKKLNKYAERLNSDRVDEFARPLMRCSTIGREESPEIKVSMFDCSVENHIRFIDEISKLCGMDNVGLEDAEVERLSLSITFLREWRFFNYKPRVVRFVSETGQTIGTKAQNEITLSQFSSAMVPEYDVEAEKVPTLSRKDFILYAGGLVWALDWCPMSEQGINSDTKCEFIAVAAHPPDSTYHKLGASLSGRGMIQVWCVLNCASKEELQPALQCPKHKKSEAAIAKKGENEPMRPRGRPRKKPIDSNHEPESQSIQALVQLPEETPDTAPADEDIQNSCAPRNTSTSLCGKKLSEENDVEREENVHKKPKRRSRKSAIDNTPEVSEGQFIPALAVQLPEAISTPQADETVLINLVRPKEKRQKRKSAMSVEDQACDVFDAEEPSLEDLGIESPQCMTNISSAQRNLVDTSVSEIGKRRRIPTKKVAENELECTLSDLRRKSRKKSKSFTESRLDSRLLMQNESEEPLISEESFLGENKLTSEEHVVRNCPTDLASGGCDNVKSTVLPRVVLCLGHDGKVAWDVKWRPNVGEFCNKHRMGYLAVVLGNGSIEVWDIPSPQVINCIFTSRCGKDTDPRFAKLKPVLRCSTLKYGDRQSMPLTMEWSASHPHDLILAGCHDGVVALWKFTPDGLHEDVRPLLCFTAETGPIRAVNWAPFDGDSESSNVIVTAGHDGLKFWDLRDPFRPLWDANPSQRFIFGLDWLPDPRCLLISYDDGTLRILSLLKAAWDVPVTGEPFSGTQQQGLHSYYCSTSAIWSIHVSRLTGIVAYSCADGTVLFFQLTQKAVEKDPFRNRAPHFLCGSFTSEEPAVAVNTGIPSSPHRMKKSATEWANKPSSARTVVSKSNQGKRGKKEPEKSPNPNEPVLALCYRDDTENGDTNEAGRSSKGEKARMSGSKNATNNTSRTPDEEEVVEVPPPKVVSMYRVRWNMNKGSERWLSYGGAAGIVRCQEIVIPNIDRKLLR